MNAGILSPFSDAPPHFCDLGLPLRPLPRGEVIRMRPLPGISRTLFCQEGTLWVTRLGSPTDDILQAGNALPCRGEDDLLIEALTPNAVYIVTMDLG